MHQVCFVQCLGTLPAHLFNITFHITIFPPLMTYICLPPQQWTLLGCFMTKNRYSDANLWGFPQSTAKVYLIHRVQWKQKKPVVYRHPWATTFFFMRQLKMWVYRFIWNYYFTTSSTSFFIWVNTWEITGTSLRDDWGIVTEFGHCLINNIHTVISMFTNA